MIDSNPGDLLIVSVTPQNLSRGVLWFAEHRNDIRRASRTNPWWRQNACTLEPGTTMHPSALSRQLVEFGYERTTTVAAPGLFAIRGGICEVWPVNTDRPWLVEFSGNTVETINERAGTQERPTGFLRPAGGIRSVPIGGYVVHVDHGIGIFRGVTTEREQHGHEISYYCVEYAPPKPGRLPDQLLVPQEHQDRLAPYVGFETPQIHRLGGALWANTKRKVRKEAEDLARHLIAIYTTRQVATRPTHNGDPTLELALRHSFAYIETPDQLRAEHDIVTDFTRTRPADRIICGDVGFGKTEVAVRAALRVIASGMQVAVLAPTTILAAQHCRTFTERFRDLPVTVETLSRMTPRRDLNRIVSDVREGRVDCLIGTHRILSKDIQFKRLGLVIIDEEQRFGVKQKEHFKHMRAETDVIALSATPIPRTLQLALADLRDVSRLDIPPPGRLPIVTLVLPRAHRTIARAIVFELRRGGQVYFLHNRIGTIHEAALAVRTALRGVAKNLNPRISTLHGRMHERDIINIMEKFRNGEIDVLIATTIIENGLDISNANTLIVEDATLLGLSELHQLRGRIGRSATQAFAYFLFKPRRITELASQRLEALRTYSGLGEGYQLALRDLEIRGAGNALGREQSGAINKVGLNLYCAILAEAVEDVRAGASA